MNRPCNNCKLSKSFQIGNRVRYFCGECTFDDLAAKQCNKMKKYLNYLADKRQYEKGKQIENIQEYLELKKSGNCWFYFNGRVKHFTVIENMQFQNVCNLIENGYVFQAVKKQR